MIKNKSFWYKLVVLVALAIPLFSIELAEAQGSSGSIKIALLGPMAAPQGFRLGWNAKIAQKEINDAGGINVGGTKKLIELIEIDTNEFTSVPDAVSAMERATMVAKADFLIGGARSEAVLAMQEIAADSKKVWIGIGAAHPEICNRINKDYNRYKGFFRIGPLNSVQIATLGVTVFEATCAKIAKALGISSLKVACVGTKAIYTEPQLALLKERLPKIGHEIVGTWRPSAKATDLTGELTAIKGSGAQVVYVSSYSPWTIPFVKGVADLGLPVALVGFNGWAGSIDYWQSTEGKCNYETTGLQVGPAIAFTEKSNPFFKKYMATHKDYPTVESPTYDGVYMLKEAIERAGSTSFDAVVAQLEKQDYPGAMGRYVFEKNHETKWGPGYYTGVGIQWLDGKPNYIWPAEWPGCPQEWRGIKYAGVVDYQVPPKVLEYWKKK